MSTDQLEPGKDQPHHDHPHRPIRTNPGEGNVPHSPGPACERCGEIRPSLAKCRLCGSTICPDCRMPGRDPVCLGCENDE